MLPNSTSLDKTPAIRTIYDCEISIHDSKTAFSAFYILCIK